MTNLQKIKDACVKANPEIMELKFGCEVAIGLKKRMVWNVEYRTDEIILINVERYGATDFFPSEYEILGRPICLSDILHTLGKMRPDILVVEAKEDGVLAKKEFAILMCDWEFTDDNLEHQSEETINFIASLL